MKFYLINKYNRETKYFESIKVDKRENKKTMKR